MVSKDHETMSHHLRKDASVFEMIRGDGKEVYHTM